ncbi:MAG: HAMP domain-containing histidine kinase [Pseudomonas sp.]|nr:HAMP domain-containing histidine kinase [Pseudomonas sp.]MDD2222596.1 HAMP domain-containing sensor histidine kinase [Pseudomonas sp.]MDY0415549.1 HAMP domain-containing sensor histidine kinase [Pseudomonas sp.]NLO53827.1 HAMP domain-containing histidine kinase [Gammaproteobacteria bacterium]
MRSLFWRILGAFWLALVLMGALTYLLVRIFNQDDWILNHHPGLKNFAAGWLSLYESGATEPALYYLQQQKHRYRIETQILDETGISLGKELSARSLAWEAKRGIQHLPWRRITQEVTGSNGQSYLFVYRIAHSELGAWQRGNGLRPIIALVIALLVLTAMSLLLTLSITRPLNRLRHAVHDLGETTYQKEDLTQLAQRRDELGVLASDFNHMGERLQGLIKSQRQLLRDVSHELRSPLARLQVALALAERCNEEERAALWPRLHLECQRLDALINEILTLARLDQVQAAKQSIAIDELLNDLVDDAALLEPEQKIEISGAQDCSYHGWSELLQRALDNLLRNALRFNPPSQPICILVSRQSTGLTISIRDHGPGVSAEWLSKLGDNFFRVPGQTQQGYGLGLTIARRAIEQHGGQLKFSNHPEGGFIATVQLPRFKQ